MDDVIPAIGAIAASMAAVWAAKAKREASQANDAVNHRHAVGTPRLYDLALRNDERTDELIEWKRGYDGGPLDDGQKVEQFVDEFERLKALQESCCTASECPIRRSQSDD